jgi:hypothetical protein
MERFGMTTGTATICVFDPAALKHRVADYADWWSDEDEELKEVNAGNVVFVALGSDGQYQVEAWPEGGSWLGGRVVTATLRCPTGRVFIGPGEDVSGGGFEPDRRRTSGRFVQVPIGVYNVAVCRLAAWQIGVKLEPAGAGGPNAFDEGLSLE